jgi:hypothetical protein
MPVLNVLALLSKLGDQVYLSVSGLDVPAVSDIGVIATTATSNLV